MSGSGILIPESPLKNSPLEGVTLQVRKVIRSDVGDVSAGQPLTWTFIEFNVEDQVLTDLIEALSRSLNPAGGLVLRRSHGRGDLRRFRGKGLSVCQWRCAGSG